MTSDHIKACLLGTVLCLTAIQAKAVAPAGVVEDIVFNDGVLSIQFACAVGNRSQFRSEDGRELRIRLALTASCAGLGPDTVGMARWTDLGTDADGLTLVELDHDPVSGSFLLLQFQTPRKPLSVRSGKGMRSLEVTLALPNGVTMVRPVVSASDTPAGAVRGALPAVGRAPVTRPGTSGAARTVMSTARIDAFMEEARLSMIAGDLGRAIAIYSRLIDLPEHKNRAAALEFLGVARQRKGQVAHAKATFNRYLTEYPDGEGHARINQRLVAITTPPTTSAKTITIAGTRGKARDRTANWNLYGSHSSYFRQNTTTIDENAEITNLSMWLSDFDLVARRRGENVNILSRLTAGYRYDFTDLGSDNGGLAIINAYVDWKDGRRRLSGRIGRQTRSSGGVYGRFDGAHLGWQWTDNVALNVVGGYPIRTTMESVDTQRAAFGVSADFGTFADAWDFSLFVNNQTIDGITDRRGVGGEVRYFDLSRNVYALVDFDTLYSTVNLAMMSASITTENRLNIHGSLDHRRNPLLGTSNAIIGQGVETFEELRVLFTEEALRALAEDNTATSTSANLGTSFPLSERFQFSTDVYYSEFAAANSFASFTDGDGVTTSAGFGAQLVATSWWRQSDAWILGLRYSDSSTFQTTSLSLNTRLPMTRYFRVNPLLRVNYRKNTLAGTEEWIVSPGLRADIRWKRRFVVEMEIRREEAALESALRDTDRSSYYFSLGYRANFGR